MSDELYKGSWKSPFDRDEDDVEAVEATEMTDAALAPAHASDRAELKPYKEDAASSLPELGNYLAEARQALGAVDDIVLKGYLARLDKMEVMVAEGEQTEDNIIIYKVDRMAYEKDEYATDKFISAFSAMTYTANSIFLIVDGFEDHTDFYIGVKNESKATHSSVANTLESSLKGQFPGIRLQDLSMVKEGDKYSAQHRLMREMREASTVSSSIGVPSLKSESHYTNDSYIQGIEKFAQAMQGKRYTAVILAQNRMQENVDALRTAYENLYSQLSCMATQQLAYSTNESLAHALTRSQGTSEGRSHSVSDGTTESLSTSESDSTSHSSTKSWSKSKGESKQNFWGKAGALAAPLMEAGAILNMTGIGAAVGVPMMAVGGALGLGSVIGAKNKTKNTTEGGSETDSTSHSTSRSHSLGTTHSETLGTTHTETFTDSEGNTSTVGSSKNFTLTMHNKKVEELLKRIDRQLERIDSADGTGLWSTTAYFLSYDVDKATAQTAAAIFRAIVQGDDSGVETSAINTWRADEKTSNGAKILSALTSFSHPQFAYTDAFTPEFPVEGTSLISSRELAMIMGLPRKSVPGLPVTDHLSFGKEVVKLDGEQGKGSIRLGEIFDQGKVYVHNKVNLDAKSLTQHVFVTGSTGSGKSETVYRLMEEAGRQDVTFLVIEPAKGEYKNVFGGANIFVTNPHLGQLIRINPFRFPEGIHVLEHIDRLVEIFNVCWPMYAAMPAVLKKAVIRSYEECGWNLYESECRHSRPIFPSFADLLQQLEKAINESAYSEEVKGNYIGSLVTRVESLTNGLNGELFSADEVADEVLFDQNTVVDLSRVGAQETKALLMGILIMRLNEYRMVTATEANAALRHITVLEEAHNILKRTSTEQSMEGSNVAGKSVELLVNSIAEMRTYGESFIIVDQSPTSVNEAAIKNTNTKVIMRLPDGEDRRIVGKSAALKDDQIDEIAKLPTGVGIVYQNDWMQPVMTKVTMMQQPRVAAPKARDNRRSAAGHLPMADILKLLLKGRLMTKVEPDIDRIENALEGSNLPGSLKGTVRDMLEEYRRDGKLAVWGNAAFPKLAERLTALLDARKAVKEAADKAADFDDLNRRLDALVKEKAELPDSMMPSVRQALMRDFAETDPSGLKIYSAWIQDAKSRIH